MTREEEVQNELKDAEINYSAVWRISNEVFTKKASQVLNVPLERTEVRRNVIAGPSWGKLSVYVYDVNDTEKAYYRISNGVIVFENLPTNITEFENELKECMKNPPRPRLVWGVAVFNLKTQESEAITQQINARIADRQVMAMETKPKELELCSKVGTNDLCRVKDSNGGIVADFYWLGEGRSQVEAEAYAKLFAASKDLLAFAIEMAERYSNSEWISKEANRVIKKATE